MLKTLKYFILPTTSAVLEILNLSGWKNVFWVFIKEKHIINLMSKEIVLYEYDKENWFLLETLLNIWLPT